MEKYSRGHQVTKITYTRLDGSRKWQKIRDDCLKKGNLYEDPDFPCADSSIGNSNEHYVWLRPKEIVRKPVFVMEGAYRFDVLQGELGDCWFLAAVANLTLNEKLFEKVVPDDQSFEENYAGVFHFRFWQYGRWEEVIVDDRLPTIDGKLIYMHSSANNEFWSALLEKAYAKVNGWYAGLDGGHAFEAMQDFTGGLAESFELKEKAPENLFQLLLQAYERDSLMSCAILADPHEIEQKTPTGLVLGHAYSVTCVKRVNIKTPRMTGKIPMIRLRNPWGNDAEWNGAWSDKSKEWQFIPEDEKKLLGLTFQNDGEFWMAFDDFKMHFDQLEICNLSPDSLLEEKNPKFKWVTNTFEGEWVRGVTAGGCMKHRDTFHQNPQYRITLIDPDEDDDDDECTLIVGLTQKNRRNKGNIDSKFLFIGFSIICLDDPEKAPKPLPAKYLKKVRPCVKSPVFINKRDVSFRYKLPPGVYCIIPSTYDPDEEGQFVLRVFTEKKSTMEENDDFLGEGEVDERVLQPHEFLNKYNLSDEEIRKFFVHTAGEDMEIDWNELQSLLNEATQIKDGFSKDICRSLVALMDSDWSGMLGFEEFKILWKEIQQWKAVFQLYDPNNTGKIGTSHLREAINSAGYRLDHHILNMLTHRYATKGSIAFDDFMMCVIRLKAMIGRFIAKAENDHTQATFSLNEWVEITSYL